MKKAIFVAINDDYAFACGNLLLGIKKHSPNLFDSCDFICYELDLSKENKQALHSIFPHITFKSITETIEKFPKELMDDERISKSRWGCFVLFKLLGFDLIREYDKALFLDVDILIQSDISDIFNYQYIAWRKNISGWVPEAFKGIFSDLDSIVGCSGGVILFSKELRQYEIKMSDFAYCLAQTTKHGGADEQILTYLIYSKGIPLQELPLIYNMHAIGIDLESAKMVHFIDQCTKPWKNPALLLAFPEWNSNYRLWLDLGGGPGIPKSKDQFVHTHKTVEYIVKQGNLIKMTNALLSEGGQNFLSYNISESTYSIEFSLIDLPALKFKIRSEYVNATISIKCNADKDETRALISDLQKLLDFENLIKKIVKLNDQEFVCLMPINKLDKFINTVIKASISIGGGNPKNDLTCAGSDEKKQGWFFPRLYCIFKRFKDTVKQ